MPVLACQVRSDPGSTVASRRSEGACGNDGLKKSPYRNSCTRLSRSASCWNAGLPDRIGLAGFYSLPDSCVWRGLTLRFLAGCGSFGVDWRHVADGGITVGAHIRPPSCAGVERLHTLRFGLWINVFTPQGQEKERGRAKMLMLSPRPHDS